MWPPRSPDLTLTDFYFRGRLNSIINAHPCNMQDRLWNATGVAVMSIRNMPHVFQRTTNPWQNGAQLAFTVMVDYLSIFCKLLVTGYSPSYFIANTFFITAMLSAFPCSCFLLPYLFNEATVTM
jgi:hypothetical protein